MKIKSIVETTTSGSIATVATNMTPGKPIKRQSSPKVKTEKKLYANSLHEGDDSREKQDDNDLKNTGYNPFDRNRAPGQKPDPRSEKYRKMIASKAASRKSVKEEGYQDTIQSRYDAQVKKYNATPIGPLDEAGNKETNYKSIVKKIIDHYTRLGYKCKISKGDDSQVQYMFKNNKIYPGEITTAYIVTQPDFSIIAGTGMIIDGDHSFDSDSFDNARDALRYLKIPGTTSPNTLDEAELREEDIVLAPGKGSKYRADIMSKTKSGALAKFSLPFKATGCWVSDKRGNRMSECETAEIASEVARVLNSEIKNPTTVKETEEVYEADDSAVGTGWSNAKALLQAYERKASAELQLGGDVVMLEYPEVRFVLGIYKQAVKDGRHEEILRLLADPYKFHKMMKKMGNMLYRDRSSQNAAAAGERLAGGLGEARRRNTVTYNYKLPDNKVGKAEVPIPDADDDDSWNSDTSSGYDRDELRRQAIMRSVKEGAKVDRMVKHIAKSEKGLGKSKKDAESIAWATANKRGMLDNKNKKPKE